MSADTPPQRTTSIQTPEPTGDPCYVDPLLDYIGSEITVEWCNREVEGVVVDINLDHTPECFVEQLVVETETTATLTVSPDDVIE